jgi:hypothetical protein
MAAYVERATVLCIKIQGLSSGEPMPETRPM